MKGVQLFCGDCLEILPTLAPGSVDAVVTDVPYGVGMRTFDDNMNTAVKGFDLCPANLAVTFISPRRVIDFANKVKWKFERLLWWHKQADIAMPWRGWCMNGEAIAVFSRGGAKWPKNTKCRSDTYQTGPEKEKPKHPCGKPLSVVKDLIEHLTDREGGILDPFMGSGTTGVACIQTGRKFIGIEIDKTYFEIAKERIERAKYQESFNL